MTGTQLKRDLMGKEEADEKCSGAFHPEYMIEIPFIINQIPIPTTGFYLQQNRK